MEIIHVLCGLISPKQYHDAGHGHLWSLWPFRVFAKEAQLPIRAGTGEAHFCAAVTEIECRARQALSYRICAVCNNLPWIAIALV